MGASTLFGVAQDHLPAVWALPALAVLAVLLCRVSPASALARLVAAGCLFAGGVHLAIIPTHLSDPTEAALFALDGVAFLLLAGWTADGRAWRVPVGALALATIAGYVAYQLLGWEQVDTVGVVTTLLEAALLALAVRGERRCVW